MPGIVGIIGAGSPPENNAMLSQMLKSMAHESFYKAGSYVNSTAGVYLGWTSLAGTFSDCMPAWNETRDICLIFHGENFADPEDIQALKSRGHQFDPQTAEYLVHLYEESGPRFFDQLNGTFSGLLVDLRQRTTLLFNDRYGLRRIYYHEAAGGNFYFATEAKALLKILPSLRNLDLDSLSEFFSCGCPLQNRSYFSGVSLLPGGSKWTFCQDGTVNKGIYFCPETWARQTPLREQDCYDELQETFQRILPRYFQSKQPVAISLTGGVDSRMVMAWANPEPESLPCFTFAGPFRDCVDVKVARQVAKICGQKHHVIPVGQEFLNQFSELAAQTVYLSDGAMDMTGTPDLYVNRIVRGIAPVRMTGNYGGEILRSLVAFKPMPLPTELFNPGFALKVQNAGMTYGNELQGRRLTFVAFKQVPWHHYSRLALELSQVTVRSPYLDNDLVALAFRFPEVMASSNYLSLRLIHEGNPALSRLGTDRGVRFEPLPLLTSIKHAFQEFTFKAEYAYDYGMPHWLARVDNAFEPFHLERMFLGRHKFYHFRLWYRDQLAGFVKDILLDAHARSRPYLDGRRLEEFVHGHISGRRNYTMSIHRLLTAELIQRHLIESQ